MSTIDTDKPSEHVKQVLRLLKVHHNVLIAGPPATEKSRLLAEIRYWFQQTVKPAMRPHEKIPLPAGASVIGLEEWLPSPERTDRKVDRITFHQGTKYRDFVSGFAPSVSGGNSSFVVTHGPLFSAAEHAKSPKGAALIEVDEINRGPAVTIFGDTITAIESDKRQPPDGQDVQDGKMITTFAMLKDDGTSYPYSLPHHLYIVAAMNEADTSVEPLDVAFLRRFVKYRLVLDEPALRTYFSLQADKQALPDPLLPLRMCTRPQFRHGPK